MSRRAPLLVLVALLLVSVVSAGAGTVSIPYSFSPNTTIQSSQVNSNFSTIYNEFNGNIGDANVGSLSESKTTFTGTGHDHSGGSKGALVYLPVVNGRLGWTSATQITFAPSEGNRILIKKSGAWTGTTIPSGGIAANNTSVFVGGVAGQNLAASTLYYVYLFDNSGTLTIDYVTTNYAIDTTTGLKIKSGDDTRLLIGMVRTNASSQFQDQASYRGVVSFYNRFNRDILTTFTADRSTTSTTYVELNTEIRAQFLMWNGDAIQFSVVGSVSNSGANDDGTAIGFDGTTAEAGFETSHHETNAGVPNGIAISGWKSISLGEGFHYATLLGKTTAGTATWSSATGASAAKVYIQGMVRG